METSSFDASSHASNINHDAEDSYHSTGRRRVSRACDQCNASRRRCDGQQPCGCCVQTRRDCQYERQQKRRGRLSRMRQSAFGGTERSHQEATDSRNFETDSRAVSAPVPAEQSSTVVSLGGNNLQSEPHPFPDLEISPAEYDYGMSDFLDGWLPDMQHHQPQLAAMAVPQYGLSSNTSVNAQGHAPGSATSGPTGRAPIEVNPRDLAQSSAQTRDMHLNRTDSTTGRQPAAQSFYLSNTKRRNTGHGPTRREQDESSDIYYPVLDPLLPALRKIMPDSLSFDLLKAYFETSTLKCSPKISVVPCSVLDKQSFLSRKHPRKTSKVLLASMLWLSAQEADIPLLESNVAKRKHIRRRLLQLTTQLLKPLSEVAFVGYIGEMHSQYFDECMAYVHLAMVTSASAFKRASLRWWNMAFSLAREINLHLPTDLLSTGDTPPASPTSSTTSNATHDPAEGDCEMPTGRVEAQKERLRAWWFLYTMDRHISLLFNKPLSLLDSECSNLERLSGEGLKHTALDSSLVPSNPTGPSYFCTGSEYFQFFTPLSSLLGEIVYFTQARNHPRFGMSPSTFEDWHNWHAAIETRLDDFHRSLEVLQPNSPGTNQQPNANIADQASPYRRQVAHAYGEFFIHVLHVLLSGRWDPLTVLDQHEPIFSSSEWDNILSHALSSADALQRAIELDPGLQFMAFYLGIYLFQASLPFLCVADRIDGPKPDERTIKACQVLIHGLEVSTSQTSCEHQTAMVTALRIALLEMKGSVVDTDGENRLQRRRLLRKFDWTAEGRGAAC